MYQFISKLILYKDFDKHSLLYRIGDIMHEFDRLEKEQDREQIIDKLYRWIHDLLHLATQYGFDKNLWQHYLTFLLITNENPFSLTCEKIGARDGSVNQFALNDYKIFYKLYAYDFSDIEKTLGIHCFHIITNYTALEKNSSKYNWNVSDKVRNLNTQLVKAESEEQFFTIMTDFYRQYGVGTFGLNKAFRLQKEVGPLEIVPITNTQEIVLSDLIGYEIQKQKLIDNTKAFVEGKKANNVLLYGDSGTGKSTSVKAILNEYYQDGLRMIEIYKHQFQHLSEVIARVKNRNYKFIIYMDDLSFEEFEIEYKYLKAVIEGGLETKPDNVLIYATSNRRHLIKETWNDRSDMERTEELHRSDTMQEKLSLVSRFGITINYSAPAKKEFNEIVINLAKKQANLNLSEEELCAKANQWELFHGGMSGRTAQQFIDYLAGKGGYNGAV